MEARGTDNCGPLICRYLRALRCEVISPGHNGSPLSFRIFDIRHALYQLPESKDFGVSGCVEGSMSNPASDFRALVHCK
jgi:hypothetical protein